MNYFCFSQQIGSFFLSPAHGWRGARATIQNVSAPPSAEKIRVVQQAGKKEGGLGEGIFARLLCRAKRGMGWEAVAHSASAEGQSRKFFFLKGKIKNGKGAPKNEWKNFLLCSPQGECRRWAGSASVRAQIVAQRKFERRSVIATIIDFLVFEGSLIARSAPLARRSARIFPYISALNHTAGENQRGFFCPAGGGSWWRSHQSKSSLIEKLLNAFALQFFPSLAEGKRTKQVFNSALYIPTKVGMAKGD